MGCTPLKPVYSTEMGISCEAFSLKEMGKAAEAFDGVRGNLGVLVRRDRFH